MYPLDVQAEDISCGLKLKRDCIMWNAHIMERATASVMMNRAVLVLVFIS